MSAMPDDENPSPEELERRARWFHDYVERLEKHSVVRAAKEGQRFACPCCGFLTLRERGGFQVCKVCFWEDDGQDDHDADVVRGGPNGLLSLTRARANFAAFGASDERNKKHVRPPLPDEFPDAR
jgi:cysteine-rich CPCC protein